MATSNVITMAAKELKNRTGEALRAAERGDRVVVTRRGRPVAVLVPAASPPAADALPPYEEAWRDIEAALGRSKPTHRTWRDAVDRSRRRP